MSDERLQKILAECGIASRRRAEELIAAGKVKVNGRRAQVGDKADLKRDTVTVEGKRLSAPEKKLYLMLNKPRGFVTTLRDEQGRKCVADLVTGAGARVFPVGRLDRDSEGLLLLTNDGEFANALTHPSSHVPKVYRVTIRQDVTEEQAARFCAGMLLDGRQTAPAEFHILLKEPTRTVAEVVLYEGRNRQIRRMCESLGLEVIRLRRTSIGGVRLGMLQPGKWRPLEPQEVKLLMTQANIKSKEALRYTRQRRVEGNDRQSARR